VDNISKWRETFVRVVPFAFEI